jgi:photosystem II stability/assembly factor-like uncharacterized protein
MFRFIIPFLVFISACTSSSTKIVFAPISSPTTITLREIQKVNDSLMFMIGGVLYNEGELYRSNDEGHSWIIVNKKFNGGLFGLHFENSNKGTLTGWPSTIFETTDGGLTFSLLSNNVDHILRSPLIYGNKKFIVGGIGFESGSLWSSSYVDSAWTSESFDRSYYKIMFNKSNTGYLAGYGLVQRSVDSGKTWNVTECKGDVWIDIDFTSSRTGFVLGYEGKIMKTNDDGIHWTKMRSANSVFQSTQFSACDFVDESRGVIVGYGGIIEWTDNGGYSWTRVKEFTKSHFRDVLFLNRNNGIVIGDDGLIYSFIIQ